MNAAAAAANQAVADLVERQKRAQARIADIDRLLTAAADVRRWKDALTQANTRIADTRTRCAQVKEIEDTLNDQIANFTQKRGNVLAQRGAE